MTVSRYGRVRVLSQKGKEALRTLQEDDEHEGRRFLEESFTTGKDQMIDSLIDLIRNEAEMDRESLPANLTWVFDNTAENWVKDMIQQEVHDWVKDIKVSANEWPLVDMALQREFEREWDDMQESATRKVCEVCGEEKSCGNYTEDHKWLCESCDYESDSE